MKQQTLDAMHDELVRITQMWVDGILTDVEFTKTLGVFHVVYARQREAMMGLIDPATGLSFTPEGAGKGMQFEPVISAINNLALQ